MSHRFPDGHVPKPRNPQHRYDLLVDAVAELDGQALYELVCRHHATVEDILAAAEQTDRTSEELAQALAAWFRTETAACLAARERSRLINTLTQPPLLSRMELS